MFLTNDKYAISGCGTITCKGWFLMLVRPRGRDNDPVKAVVRKVVLRNCGQFMMGHTRIYGEGFVVSGAYGSDGLIMSIPPAIYDRLRVELPPALYEAWNSGGGWNDAGTEAPAMREWALANINALRK